MTTPRLDYDDSQPIHTPPPMTSLPPANMAAQITNLREQLAWRVRQVRVYWDVMVRIANGETCRCTTPTHNTSCVVYAARYHTGRWE